MPNLIVLFNHTLTQAQETDARASLAVAGIIEPPEEIKSTWSQVPPEADALSDYLAPVRAWLSETSRPGDFVLIQGEFGATCSMVREAAAMGLIPIYSTTRRVAVEEPQDDGSVVMRHLFSHVRFRRYEEP